MAVENGSESKPADSENKPVADASAQKAGASAGKKSDRASAGTEINVDEFGRLVASMSRLLSSFGQLKPLRDARLGLGEWVALGIVARREGMTSKLMSERLGIPTQRAAQILVSLAESGLISIGQPSEDAESDNVTKVTDAGRIKLEAVNSEMKAVLTAGVKARTLSGALQQMKPLSRIASASTQKRSRKSKAKQAKGAKQTKVAKPAKGEAETSGTRSSPAQA